MQYLIIVAFPILKPPNRIHEIHSTGDIVKIQIRCLITPYLLNSQKIHTNDNFISLRFQTQFYIIEYFMMIRNFSWGWNSTPGGVFTRLCAISVLIDGNKWSIPLKNRNFEAKNVMAKFLNQFFFWKIIFTLSQYFENNSKTIRYYKFGNNLPG